MNNSEYSSNPQSFQCPTCGAGLPIPETATITCSYCGSVVVVPPELRPQRKHEELLSPTPVVIKFSTADIEASAPQKRNAAGWVIGCVVFGIVASTLLAGLLAFAGVFTTTRGVTEAIESVVTVQSDQSVSFPTLMFMPTVESSAAPASLAKMTLQFGSEGTGPGQFQDARHIAVDRDGNIFVADYDTGRLQKFTPDGKFVQLVNVESNQNDYAIIMDMAADLAGHLYVVRLPDILSYSSGDLSPAQPIPGRFPDTNFRFLAIDPANFLYAVSDGAQFTDLIKMDGNGNEEWRVQGVIFNLDQRLNPSVDDVAADGLGNSYLVNDVDARVYKYDAAGKYMDRFGVKGDEPGQLNFPSHIVIDPQGRLAISDQNGFDFFTSEGDFLDGFTWDYSLGGIRSFAFDLEGHLFVVTTSQQVVKFELNF